MRRSNGWASAFEAIQKALAWSEADVTLRARVVDDEWLEVVAQYTNAQGGCDWPWWSLLRLNERLRGCPRVGVSADGDVGLRADLFVEGTADTGEDNEQNLDERMAVLSADMCSAHDALRNAVILSPTDWPRVQENAQLDAAGRLLRLCAEAGWKADLRASGQVLVALDPDHAAFQARLSVSETGAPCACVPFIDASVTTPSTRDGIALLLLALSSVVRCVKGVTITQGDVELAGVATACEPSDSAAAVDRMLSALAVACCMAGREAQALQNDALAREYLALRWPPRGEPGAGRHSDAIAREDVGLVVPGAFINSTTQEDTSCLQLP